MTVSLLLAMDRNNGIGRDGKLPWRLPADQAYFKKLTLGHTVLMGRRTFQFDVGRPLPNRRNVIVTRDRSFRAEGCEVVHELGEALDRYGGDELFVIGGGEIYEAVLPVADKLYITRIEHEFAADTFFPEIDETVWQLVSREPGVKDERNPYDYAFLVYERAAPGSGLGHGAGSAV